MDPRWLDSIRKGAVGGAIVAAASILEMVAWNRRTLNLQSTIVLALVWETAGLIAGVAAGWLGGRAFAIFRMRPTDGAAFFGVLVAGQLFLPAGAAALLAIPVLLLRFLRRRAFPSVSRVDTLFPVAAAAAASVFLLHGAPSSPPTTPPGVGPTRDVPLPGSSPVAITVHSKGGFPDVAAVHVPLRRLRSSDAGRRAALWTGRIPDRTRTGRDLPRRLPGGGGLSRVPDRLLVRRLAGLFPAARDTDVAFQSVGSLPELVAAAGVPVLRTPPADGDPVLHLRVLESVEPPSAELAAALARTGVWIDVAIGAGVSDGIAIAGEGIHVRPSRSTGTLADVTPTVLHLLGLAVPRDCDGRVLTEILDREGRAGRPIRYRSLVDDRAGGDAGVVPESGTTSESMTSR